MNATKEEIRMVGEAAVSLVELATSMHPGAFRSALGGVLGNLVGNMPEDYWKEFSHVTPCGTPGCNCHIAASKVMKGLAAVRRDYKACVGKAEGGGFAA